MFHPQGEGGNVAHRHSAMEYKSAARRSFEHYLRTGRWLAVEAGPATSGQKFNPYHDPRNGRFTFAPGGPRSLSHVVISDRRHGRVDAAKLPSAASSPDTRPNAQSNTSQAREAARLTEAVYRLEGSGTRTISAEPARPHRWQWRTAALNDPMTWSACSLACLLHRQARCWQLWTIFLI